MTHRRAEERRIACTLASCCGARRPKRIDWRAAKAMVRAQRRARARLGVEE